MIIDCDHGIHGVNIDGRRHHDIVTASSSLLSHQVGSNYMHVDDVRVLIDWHIAETRDVRSALCNKEEELARERLKHQKLLATHRTFEYRSHRRLMLLKSRIKRYEESALYWYDRFSDYKQTLIDVTGGYHREALKVSNAPYDQNIFHSRNWLLKRAKIHGWLDAAAKKIDGLLPSGFD
jgi:hypothetical protein